MSRVRARLVQHSALVAALVATLACRPRVNEPFECGTAQAWQDEVEAIREDFAALSEELLARQLARYPHGTRSFYAPTPAGEVQDLAQASLIATHEALRADRQQLNWIEPELLDAGGRLVGPAPFSTEPLAPGRCEYEALARSLDLALHELEVRQGPWRDPSVYLDAIELAQLPTLEARLRVAAASPMVLGHAATNLGDALDPLDIEAALVRVVGLRDALVRDAEAATAHEQGPAALAAMREALGDFVELLRVKLEHAQPAARFDRYALFELAEPEDLGLHDPHAIAEALLARDLELYARVGGDPRALGAALGTPHERPELPAPLPVTPSPVLDALPSQNFLHGWELAASLSLADGQRDDASAAASTHTEQQLELMARVVLADVQLLAALELADDVPPEQVEARFVEQLSLSPEQAHAELLRAVADPHYGRAGLGRLLLARLRARFVEHMTGWDGQPQLDLLNERLQRFAGTPSPLLDVAMFEG